MMNDQGVLLRLDDDMLVDNIISRLDDTRHLSCTCKRLSKLVRQTVESLQVYENDNITLANLSVSCTYARCKGVCYYADDADDPSLPELSALLSHLLHWHSLSEVAVVVQKPSDANPAIRQANDAVLRKIQHLSAVSSLRHLQLYKTAPLIADAAQLAHLTQLTSLILADSSYIPGPEAMLQVDLQPLSALTQLRSIALSGICPLAARQDAAAADDYSTAAGSTSSIMSTVSCLPTSVTSLLLKHYDELGLQLWLPHLWSLASLQILQIESYQEAPGSIAYESFPAPLLELLADKLPGLQYVDFTMDDWGEKGRRRSNADCRLPISMSNLQQLRKLSVGWCQVRVDTAEQWGALAGLGYLISLGDIQAYCAPPVSYQLPCLTCLSLSTADLWAEGGGFSLHSTFPQLRQLRVLIDNTRQWLSVAPCIALCCSVTRLSVGLRFIADVQCVDALHRLGTTLPRLLDLRISWCGGPARWCLPDFSTFSKIECLHLLLPKPGTISQGTDFVQSIGDAQVLAYLAPLTQLKGLLLRGFVAITPALVLGLQALMPQLQCCILVRCSPEILMLDADAGWQGNDMQLVRAALRKGLQLEVFATLKQQRRAYQDLPCSIQYVDAHKYRF